MNSMKLKKKDIVIIVRGNRKDRGKTGKIKMLISDKNRLVVEKVHIVKEYIRPNPQKNIQGGIVDRESSIPVANVMYYCRECEQGVRIGYRVTDDSKQRICKKCETVLE
jgi:large subunit ribosomal protein L24